MTGFLDPKSSGCQPCFEKLRLCILGGHGIIHRDAIRFLLKSVFGWSIELLNPFRTAIPFWGQTTWILSGLSPKRDCRSKRVKWGASEKLGWTSIVECMVGTSRTKATRANALSYFRYVQNIVISCCLACGSGHLTETIDERNPLLSGEKKKQSDLTIHASDNVTLG